MDDRVLRKCAYPGLDVTSEAFQDQHIAGDFKQKGSREGRIPNTSSPSANPVPSSLPPAISPENSDSGTPGIFWRNLIGNANIGFALLAERAIGCRSANSKLRTPSQLGGSKRALLQPSSGAASYC